MFCPQCGAQAIESRSLCERCGTNLDLGKPAMFDRVIHPPAGTGEWDETRRAGLRTGVVAVLSGAGLGVFLYLFFHSLGFAAIGAFPFAAGTAKIVNTLFFYSPVAEK